MWNALKGPVTPRTVGAGRGIEWWRGAWALFMRQPVICIALALLMAVLLIVASAVPVLGGLAASVLAPVLIGGWLVAARKVQAGHRPVIDDLFHGFKDSLVPLLTLGGVLLVGTLVVSLLGSALSLGAVIGVFTGLLTGSPPQLGSLRAGMGAGLIAMVLSLLLSLALGMVLAMALWFAPGLVLFQRIAPLDAVKASLDASLRNWLAFLLHSVVYLVAALLASLPFGLGWIVLLPLLLLTLHTSYRDVFGGR